MALFGKKQNDVQEVELFTEEPNERASTVLPAQRHDAMIANTIDTVNFLFLATGLVATAATTNAQYFISIKTLLTITLTAPSSAKFDSIGLIKKPHVI